MSRLTRRSFVKRTGTVTLGSALGLGLLPSVTRKLHATDSSTSLYGEEHDETNVVGVPEPYPPTSPKGTMEISIDVSGTVPKNTCRSAFTLVVLRKVKYKETRQGVLYSGTAEISSFYVWICEDGVVKMTTSGNDTGKKEAAIVNAAGASIGVLFSDAPSPGAYKAKVFWQPPGVHGPWVEKDSRLTVRRCDLA